QLGIAVHAYHDTAGRFPCEDFDPVTKDSQPLRGTTGVRWQQFNLWISLLPYIEQGNQLSGSGAWMLVQGPDTSGNPPGSGSNAGPVKILLCPSRRTTVVGPKTDFAMARQD